MRTAHVSMVLVLAWMPALLSAQEVVAPADVQVEAALAPLPESFRDDATVLGYRAGAEGLVPLRERDGSFICLADNPAEERFHVACYHRALEPFMARGRELRAEGRGEEVDELRAAEIERGTLAMPDEPAALYSLTGTAENLDADTGEVNGARRLFVIYVPFATAESTGLSTQPSADGPWLMSPGTPGAHIMFTARM